MKRMTYEQAYADHSALWAIAPAHDMTGEYVDSEDLAKMLSKPTKATARDCLVSQIRYWFEKGPDEGSYTRNMEALEEHLKSNNTVREIHRRHVGPIPGECDDDDN